MRVLKAADAPIDELAFSPDGSAVAAYVAYHGLYLWDLASDPLARLRIDGAESKYKGGLAFSPDGRSLIWLMEGVRRIYDRESGQTHTEKNFVWHRRNITFNQTTDGLHGISLHGLPDLRLIGWQFVEGLWVQMWSIDTSGLAVESLTLSTHGQLFAMLTRHALGEGWQKNPYQLEVRNAANKDLKGIGEYTYAVRAKLRFSPDGCQLVGLNAMNLLVWQIPEAGDMGKPRTIRNTTRKNFTAMAYHPSGRYLYVTSNGENDKDATVHVFDTTTWERTEQFIWQLGNLKAVAVSPDGTLAAAGSDRGDIVIWDVDL